MRPARLELEGFTVFRNKTTVDFAGADLFALTGPTGAGKTSLIDAVTFALYGAVPRLDRRAVAPVVSQNLTEARVRLDFTVGDTAYAAVRVVRATKTGATTKEARLERLGAVGAEAGSGEVLAGNADEVTEAVSELLGLTFDHFTTCVSLPQGQFARFLHDKPRDRQDLLVRLLGLGLYDAVARRARQRAAEATGQADVLEGRLAQLGGATEEARDTARARVAELEALAAKVDAAAPELQRLAKESSDAQEAASDGEARLKLVQGLAAPDDVGELARLVAESGDERQRLAASCTEAEDALVEAEKAVAALPVRSVVEARIQDVERLAELTESETRGATAADEAGTRLEEALAAEAAAEKERQAAADGLDAAQTAARAHALVPHLAVGEPCPVCRQEVGELPEIALPEVDEARRAVDTAEKALAEARKVTGEARTHQARVDEKLTRVRSERDEVRARLETTPEGWPGAAAPDGADALAAVLEQVAAAEKALTGARAEDRSRRQARDAQAARHEKLLARETEARRQFDQARDKVAPLDPPVPDRADLAEDWSQLAAWAEGLRPTLADEVQKQRDAADAAGAEHRRRWQELADLCRATGVDLPTGSPPAASGPGSGAGEGVPAGIEQLGSAVSVARARAGDAVERLDQQIAEAEALRKEQQAAAERRQVAESLAGHLKANRFEKWLLDEAVLNLTASASGILSDLSSGAYSLSVDTKNGGFTVIDHANASQARSARTLSGGETFLASLALALGLADQVAELATGGTARLETLFLDEGFGTLDADTLDVVATALDELGARGRMVGIVTHVRDLAERLPVRFEVTKVGAESGVERVEEG